MSSSSSSSSSTAKPPAAATTASGLLAVQPVATQGEIPDQMWFLIFISHASRLAALVAGLPLVKETDTKAEIDSINTAFRNWVALNRNRLRPRSSGFNMGKVLQATFNEVKEAVANSPAAGSLGGEAFLASLKAPWYQPNATGDELVKKLTIGRGSRFYIRKSTSQPGQFALHYVKGTSPAAYTALISPVGQTTAWKTVGDDKRTYEFPTLGLLLEFIDRGLTDESLKSQEKNRPIQVLRRVIESVNAGSFGASSEENVTSIGAYLEIVLYITDLFIESKSAENTRLQKLILENLGALVKCAAYAMSGDSASSANQYEQVLASAIKIVLLIDQLNLKK